MRVVTTLISWIASNTMVAWSITMVGHVKKSYGGLSWPMVLWIRSAQVSGVVGTCADGQSIRIFESLVIPVSLYGCVAWTLNTDLKR